MFCSVLIELTTWFDFTQAIAFSSVYKYRVFPPLLSLAWNSTLYTNWIKENTYFVLAGHYPSFKIVSQTKRYQPCYRVALSCNCRRTTSICIRLHHPAHSNRWGRGRTAHLNRHRWHWHCHALASHLHCWQTSRERKGERMEGRGWGVGRGSIPRWKYLELDLEGQL